MSEYKNFESFEEFKRNLSSSALNESSINISIGSFETTEQAEEAAARNFIWNPPVKPIQVDKLEADFVDDFNAEVSISMTNGDKIQYVVKEQSKPTKQTKIPPFYSFEMRINNKLVHEDLDDVLGNTGTIIGDILLAYENWLDKNYKVKESVNESMNYDTKYWADYEKDTSGQGDKSFEKRMTDGKKLESFINDAIESWNDEAEDPINANDIKNNLKIKSLAFNFFIEMGWINTNIIHSMIMQEWN